MKRILTTLFCAVLAFVTSAQTLSITNFTQLDDLDARAFEPILDQNGQKCAILKVVTTEKNFTFDVGALGVRKVVYKTAEIWVYVPEGTRKIKIAHPQLGQLKTETNDGFYWLPMPLKAATSYRFELVSGKVRTIVEEDEIQTGYLIIRSTPDKADVYITENGRETYAGQTPFQKKMAYGTYLFRVAKNLYYDDNGRAEIKSDRAEYTCKLTPKFGTLQLTSVPSGARVVVEGQNQEYTTPCTIEFLPSGEHNVRLFKDRYNPVSQSVTITDGKTTTLQVPLQANFATVTINTLPEATIHINDRQVAKGSYTTELNEGIYDIEARLASHRTVKKQVQVIANQPQTVALEPEPIYGKLDIMSEPMDAHISLNGKDYGITPKTISKLLIGTYTLTLSKDGCSSLTKTITIEEGKTTTLSETLPTGKEITVTTGASGDKIYIDNQYVGLSPLTQSLSFGEHSFYAERNGKRCSAKSVNVTQTGAANVSLAFSNNMTCTANGVSFEMVYVEGGTFTMGATSEQGSDADSDEKPTHQVTLSDYYIGKYEVTQELWQAVMGNNPSYYTSSKQNPVEQVSWNDCQDFIKELNTICHKNGTLPADKNFYLPTEAQWEYAARGGKKSKGYKYSGSNNISDVAWYDSNSSSKTHPVGTKAPNELGIYDMSGNVWELCSDWYGSYSSNAQTNPTGAFSGSSRVYRGGSWFSSARYCRVAFRNYDSPDRRYSILGLRLSVR